MLSSTRFNHFPKIHALLHSCNVGVSLTQDTLHRLQQCLGLGLRRRNSSRRFFHYSPSSANLRSCQLPRLYHRRIPFYHDQECLCKLCGEFSVCTAGRSFPYLCTTFRYRDDSICEHTSLALPQIQMWCLQGRCSMSLTIFWVTFSRETDDLMRQFCVIF